MSSSDGARFLRWFAALLGGAFLCLFTLTFLVDPRGMVALTFPHAPRLCEQGIGNSRFAKLLLPQTHRPREVMLGTSRVSWGFSDAASEAYLQQPAVNLGVDAASLEEVAAYFRLAADSGRLRRAWIELDFGQFLDEQPVALMEQPMRSRASILLYGVAEPSAVRAALRALFSPGCSQPRLTVRGFPQSDRAGALSTRVVDQPRMASAISIIETKTRSWLSDRQVAERRYTARLETVRRLAAEAQARGISLIFFIPPMHPGYRVALERAQAMGAYQRLRRDLANMFRAAPPSLQFHDFTDLPEAEARGACLSHGAAPCPFFDPVHFRPSVGAAILRAGSANLGGPRMGGRNEQ